MRRVSAVVLAAGPSSRHVAAGHDLKQLLPFEGESLVRRTTRAALASKTTQVIVVVGCQAARVRAEVVDLGVEIALNERFLEGQSSSVRIGLGRVEETADGALFLPCDQPYLDAPVLDSILDAYTSRDAAIVVPTFRGKRRAPVLFDRSLFGELAGIVGDSGGRQLFDAHAERLLEVEIATEQPLLDVDTPEEYRRLRERLP